jgi:hypothetical protein
VLLTEAGQTTLKSVPISRNIPSRTILIDSRCVVLTLDEHNPQDSLVVAIYSGRPGIPNAQMAFVNNITVNTPANNTSTYVDITNVNLNLFTGPGKVETRLDGALYLGNATGGGTAKVRIKCVLNELTVSGSTVSSTIYLPDAVGWHVFFSNNNIYYHHGFSAPLEVPSGTHTFQVQFRGNSMPAGGTINLDANGNYCLEVKELT